VVMIPQNTKEVFRSGVVLEMVLCLAFRTEDVLGSRLWYEVSNMRQYSGEVMPDGTGE